MFNKKIRRKKKMTEDIEKEIDNIKQKPHISFDKPKEQPQPQKVEIPDRTYIIMVTDAESTMNFQKNESLNGLPADSVCSTYMSDIVNNMRHARGWGVAE